MKVWVNGTFDILHKGHIELLKFANSYGVVRVGLDTDDRIKKMKGELRPINKLSDRIIMMESIKYVDSVVSFGTDEELEYQIGQWSPDYIIIGDDYKNRRVIGSEIVPKIIFFEKISGYSTTDKINQINLCK